jgi:hypothetical protein
MPTNPHNIGFYIEINLRRFFGSTETTRPRCQPPHLVRWMRIFSRSRTEIGLGLSIWNLSIPPFRFYFWLRAMFFFICGESQLWRHFLFLSLWPPPSCSIFFATHLYSLYWAGLSLYMEFRAGGLAWALETLLFTHYYMLHAMLPTLLRGTSLFNFWDLCKTISQNECLGATAIPLLSGKTAWHNLTASSLTSVFTNYLLYAHWMNEALREEVQL